MVVLPIISALIFTGYIIYLKYFLKVFDGLKSISESIKYLPNQVIFTFVLWTFSVPVMAAGHSAWMVAAGICFVASAPNYWHKTEGDVHVIAAYSGVGLSAIAIAVSSFWYLAVMEVVGLVIIQLRVKNRTKWQEILAFYMVIIFEILINTINP